MAAAEEEGRAGGGGGRGEKQRNLIGLQGLARDTMDEDSFANLGIFRWIQQLHFTLNYSRAHKKTRCVEGAGEMAGGREEGPGGGGGGVGEGERNLRTCASHDHALGFEARHLCGFQVGNHHHLSPISPIKPSPLTFYLSPHLKL